MFVPYTFSSVNRPGQMRRGVYRSVAEFFGGGPGEIRLTLIHYVHEDDTQASAVDLVAFDVDDSVRVCDYLWLPDRSWRDSSGLKGNHLKELMPPELMSLPAVGRLELPDVEVSEAGEVQP